MKQKQTSFLLLPLKTISVWAFHFYKNSFVVTVLMHNSFFLRKIVVSFSSNSFQLCILFISVPLCTEDCFIIAGGCFKSVYYQELHSCVPRIILNTKLVTQQFWFGQTLVLLPPRKLDFYISHLQIFFLEHHE